MGMDYIGKNGDWHVNWSGHSYLLGVLTQLGADLTEWSGSNDGVRIPAKTCRAWAKLITDNIGRIRTLQVKNASYQGGWKDFGFVEGKDLKEELATGIAGQLVLMEASMGSSFSREDAIDPKAVRVVPLSTDYHKWLLDIAAYFEGCGGCEQW